MMTIYLSEKFPVTEIAALASIEDIMALKYYPAGATTNSQYSVNKLRNCYKIFEEMSKFGVVLCVHGEVVDDSTDIFDRERKFIEQDLVPLKKEFPNLKIVFEHISTIDAVDFVKSAANNLAATITPQHLIFNRNDMLVGGIKPHRYCAPILKTEKDREALVDAATSGHENFFMGTDSAPHLIGEKESNCGCAGCYSAPHAIPIYLEIFETQNKLKNFEKFSSFNGANFYGLPFNKEKVVIRKQKWIPNKLIHVSKEKNISPLALGMLLNWKLDL